MKIKKKTKRKKTKIKYEENPMMRIFLKMDKNGNVKKKKK